MSIESRILRMQEDLKRALKKPVGKRSWVMVIDADRCIACHACTVSCKAENALPPGVSYRVVREAETGEFPNVKRFFMPTNCQQCDNPPCVKGLRKEMYTKRPDGILVFNYDRLRGKDLFKKVQSQCPYTAVYYDDGRFYTEGTPRFAPYEARDSFEYGKRWRRKGTGPSPIGAVRKCHFCLHRLEAGMLPACVTTCVGGAMHFGDRNDPRSLVSELLKQRQTLRINEAEGTKPRVVYVTGVVATVQECAECHG